MAACGGTKIKPAETSIKIRIKARQSDAIWLIIN